MPLCADTSLDLTAYRPLLVGAVIQTHRDSCRPFIISDDTYLSVVVIKICRGDLGIGTLYKDIPMPVAGDPVTVCMADGYCCLLRRPQIRCFIVCTKVFVSIPPGSVSCFRNDPDGCSVIVVNEFFLYTDFSVCNGYKLIGFCKIRCRSIILDLIVPIDLAYCRFSV